MQVNEFIQKYIRGTFSNAYEIDKKALLCKYRHDKILN